jgi:hypothetical protein
MSVFAVKRKCRRSIGMGSYVIPSRNRRSARRSGEPKGGCFTAISVRKQKRESQHGVAKHYRHIEPGIFIICFSMHRDISLLPNVSHALCMPILQQR